MAKRNNSSLKLRVIAILDGILTVAVLVQISYSVMYPLVAIEVTENPFKEVFQEFEKEMQQIHQLGIRSNGNGRYGARNRMENMGIPYYGRGSPAHPSAEELQAFFRLLGMPEPKTKTVISTSVWVWCYVALHIFGFVPIIASIVLIWSTKQNISRERSLELINYWISCSLFTTFLAGVELFVMIVWLRELPEWIPIPTLVYLLLRVFATFTVRNTMDTMNLNMILSPDGNVHQVQQTLCQKGTGLPLAWTSVPV